MRRSTVQLNKGLHIIDTFTFMQKKYNSSAQANQAVIFFQEPTKVLSWPYLIAVW